MRRDPIIRGISQFPRGPTTAEDAIIIMIVPCSPTIAMYVPGPNTWFVGLSNSVRISMARSPPVKRNRRTPIVYCIPTTLWSSVMRK